MRISNRLIDWSTTEGAGAGRRIRVRVQGAASVAVLCFGLLFPSLLCLSKAYGQEAQGREIQAPEKAHAQGCPDPPPETSGSHVFRRLGETIDIPIIVADCQPVALVLNWSNGGNNGSLLTVTFLDSNNQPISSTAMSVFQSGRFELPFESLDAQPWFAAGTIVAVPAMVVIQTVKPFASPAGLSYRVIRKAARVRSRPRTESPAVAQPTTWSKSEPVFARGPVLDDQVAMKLRTAEGRLLAQDQGSWASGTGEAVRYRLKELKLPEPREMEINGRRETIEFAYRLTIAEAASQSSQRVGTVQPRALSKFGLIWLGDAALPTFSLDSQEVSTLIYDRSVLRDGAQVSVSNSDGSDMHSLVERLKYQPNVQSPTASVQSGKDREEGNEVVSIKSAVRVIGAARMPLVQIELRTKRPFPPKDSALQLQIGKRFFLNELTGDHTGRTLTLTLTQEMFAELEQGSEIVAFFDKPDRSGFAGRDIWNFGKLDKSGL